MYALVVFESMFGNTQVIARAIADGLSARMSVDIVEVGAASPVIDNDVDLLVVGGPTHAFGMSRRETRQSAAQRAKGTHVPDESGLRDWLAAVPKRPASVGAAAFGTRVKRPRLPGSAARSAEKRLRKLGFRVVAAAENFYVEGTEGPLLDGEEERARRWGETLASQVTATERDRRPGKS